MWKLSESILISVYVVDTIGSDLIAGPSSKRQHLSLKLPKKKALLAESSNCFAASVDEQSREKASASYCCRHC